ncbi:MAG: LLM class flavin-dependent oxidoreductase [Acidimicrobiia bacterium]|nr:LLM class flavin-dependent oxidoreductase [Acidimicrobiia bacterium]
MAVELQLFLPQMRMSLPTLVERAQAAQRAGFDGVALMDHLAPPMALDQPMYEAMMTAGWLAANTDTLTVGHLVLCDAFRHPAVLARQAVTLDHASGGRFELGIGWGSVPAEFETFGVGDTAAKARVQRLGETLEVIRAFWAGETVDFDGVHHQINAGQQLPVPIDRIPIVIGGAGPKTMKLVAAHADWWNCPIYALDRFDELRAEAGSARPSTQEMIGFIPSEDQRQAVTEVTQRRFGQMGEGVTVGTTSELIDHLGARLEAGVERLYIWFTDFALPETLEQFGAEVIAGMR